MRRDIKGKVR